VLFVVLEALSTYLTIVKFVSSCEPLERGCNLEIVERDKIIHGSSGDTHTHTTRRR
jgi:hypothetical protein